MEEDGENQIEGEMPQSCGAPREATAPPASACLDPAPWEVRAASTTSTATPPCSLGGSGLAGRRQTKPTQLSSQPGILEDPAVPGITQGLIITGHRLLSACTPALCCDPGEVWLLHLKIHISANPTVELNLPGRTPG